jgi:hypothetical protein
MKVRISVVVLLCVGVVSLSALTGCGPQNVDSAGENGNQADDSGEGHVDPHDVPLTDEQKQQLREETAKFPDAIAKVKQLRDVVEQETKDGLPENPLDVHQALDKLDLVTELLPDIARESGVPKEHWLTINAAADELRESFDQVHQNIDNKADPDFTSVQEKIDAKLSELEGIAQ